MNKQVVIIEDDEAINDILSIMLTNHGYKVSSVPAVEYFSNIDTLRPALFLIDKNLPGMDGISICRQLKAQPATHDIPVIIISASAGFVQPAIAAGADACIEKPFSRNELFATIDKYVNKYDT
jgi:CheY-like chemotaxis protein